MQLCFSVADAVQVRQNNQLRLKGIVGCVDIDGPGRIPDVPA